PGAGDARVEWGGTIRASGWMFSELRNRPVTLQSGQRAEGRRLKKEITNQSLHSHGQNGYRSRWCSLQQADGLDVALAGRHVTKACQAFELSTVPAARGHSRTSAATGFQLQL